MEIDLSTLPFIVGLSAVLFAAYIFLYYRFVYSLVDPLLVWIVTTSFASVLAIEVVPDISDIIHFFGCQAALWCGFMMAYRKFSNSHKVLAVDHQNETFSFSSQYLLRLITYYLFIIYIISNIIIGYSKGFALFSDTPTESKIENFQQGFGLFRKINWSAGTFLISSFIFLFFSDKKRSDLFLLIIVAFLSSLEGSKSAFLRIAIAAGIIFYHPAFLSRRVLLRKFQRYIPIMIIITMAIFFSILLKENDTAEGSFYAFIRRLLYSADSLLYYYQPVNLDYFAKYSFADYITRITNPVLGFFRLQEYQEAPGNLMVDNLRPPGSWAAVTVGPNAPFYIESRIYFNYWTAFPYCAFIGYLYARIRVHYFTLTHSSAFLFVYTASFLHLAGSMIIDVNLAITQTFDLFFFVFIPFVILKFILTKRVKLRFNKELFRLNKKLSNNLYDPS